MSKETFGLIVAAVMMGWVAIGSFVALLGIYHFIKLGREIDRFKKR